MGKSSAKEVIIRQFKSITIEPAVFLYCIGLSVVVGAQITTNLLIWKVCHLELGYPESICQNLTENTNKTIELEIQEYVNNFQMYSNWIASVPIVVFSLVAGALSDEFGRKPLLMFPIFGSLVAIILDLVNYAFIDTLPIQFFYFDNIGAFFGGYAVYYLGMYSFGTNVSKPKDRAHRLARLDGMECLAYVFGSLLSPFIFKRLGYYGSFGISAALIAMALAYLALFVQEPIQKNVLQTTAGVKNGWWIAIATPFIGMKSLLMKKRKTVLKLLILLQMACFFIYWLVIEVRGVLYLYMLLIFEGFNETDFAYFSVSIELSNSFYLLLAMPFLNAKLRMHDSLMLFCLTLVEGVTFVASGFVTQLWQFYIVKIIGTISYCKYAIVRSLMSKCIEPDEVGKVFSLLALIAALAPVAGNPLFRNLYNETIEHSSWAVFTVAGGFCLLAAAGNLILYIFKGRMVISESKDKVPTIDGSLESTQF